MSILSSAADASQPVMLVSNHTSTNILSVLDGGNVGIGTTTPYAMLSVVGLGVFNNLSATSTTATSTFAGGLDVGNGAIKYDSSSGITTVDNLQVGAQNFAADSGIVSWVDMPVTSASASSTVESYSAQLNSNPVMTIYGLSDGAGGVNTLRVGINESNPLYTFDVNGDINYSGTLTNNAADIAENYPTQDTSITVGEVVAVDPNNVGEIIRATPSSSVIGIVSTRPAIVLGHADESITTGSTTKSVALAGRVPVKISVENGPIAIGDYLTLSSQPGVAMKATASGNVIGTALQSTSSDGTIMVFVRAGFTDIVLPTATSTLAQSDTSLMAEFGNIIAGTEQWMQTKIVATTGFFSNIFAKKVTTQTLCVGDSTDQVCVTKDQLKQLLINSNVAAANNIHYGTDPSPSPTSSPSPSSSPIATSTPEVSPSPSESPDATSTPDTNLGTSTPSLSPTPTPSTSPTPLVIPTPIPSISPIPDIGTASSTP